MTNYVLYDYLLVSGGAERLSIDMASGLPETSLVVTRVYPEANFLNPFVRVGKDRLKCIGMLPNWSVLRVIDAIISFFFRTKFLSNADCVVYSGCYAPLAVFNQKRGKRVYYCHTPPRYLYDWQDRYLLHIPWLFRPVLTAGIGFLKKLYEASLWRMDVIVSNSDTVRQRLKTLLGIESRVIYPPIDTKRFKWVECGDYFISLARLQPQKRVHCLIEAFLEMPDQKLIIVSGGADDERLRHLANCAKNIFFLGWQTDDQLAVLVGSARAALYIAEDEDFGMSPVEAMAAGKPVIGAQEGGLVETVIHGVTGLLLSDLSKQTLKAAITYMTPQVAISMRSSCERRAQLFSKELFLKAIFDIMRVK